MSFEVSGLCPHYQVPNLDLAVLSRRNQQECVLLREEGQVCDDASMAAGEIVRLETLQDIEDLDLTVGSTCS